MAPRSRLWAARATGPADDAARGLAAVHDDHRAGEVGGLVRGEVGEEAGDLLGRRVTPEGDPAVDLRQHLGRVFGLLHRREHVAGADGVDAHAGRPLEGQRLRQGHEPGFGGVVVGVVAIADERVGGGRVEDHAAARLEHQAAGRLRRPEGAAEVGGDDLVPLLRRDVERRVAHAHAGVVDQHVEVADSSKACVDLVAVADVAGDAAGAAGAAPARSPRRLRRGTAVPSRRRCRWSRR